MKEQTNNHDNGLSTDSQDSEFTTEGIRTHLDQVFSNPDFKASEKAKTIFRYLTEETFAGHEDQIDCG